MDRLIYEEIEMMVYRIEQIMEDYHGWGLLELKTKEMIMEVLNDWVESLSPK